MGLYAFLSAALVYVTLKEPQRGAKEEDLTEVLSKGTLMYGHLYYFQRNFLCIFLSQYRYSYQLLHSVALFGPPFSATVVSKLLVMTVIYHNTSCITQLYSTPLYSTIRQRLF